MDYHLILQDLESQSYDIHIFVPRIGYTNGQAGYLYKNVKYIAVEVNIAKTSVLYTCPKGEYKLYGEKCVSLDQIIIGSVDDKKQYCSVVPKDRRIHNN